MKKVPSNIFTFLNSKVKEQILFIILFQELCFVVLYARAQVLPREHESPRHIGSVLPALLDRDQLRYDVRYGCYSRKWGSQSAKWRKSNQ